MVEPESAFGPTTELLLVGLGSSFIDVDHFIVARSFRIDGAMHAPHRGIFHCFGLLLAISLFLIPFDLNWASVLLISFVPHHLRDSTRRGLYLYPPLVHSAPISRNIVRFLLPCFPWVIWFFRTRFWTISKVGYNNSVSGASRAFVV